MDKGFGKNWAKFPYVLEVRSSRRALPTNVAQAAVANKQAQKAQQATANNLKAIAEAVSRSNSDLTYF